MKSNKKVKVVGYNRVSTPKQIKKCAIYCRVATDKQSNQYNSLNGQEGRCRYRAERDFCEVVEVIKERRSGKSLENRKGIQRLLTLVKENKINAVYVADLNRLTRSIEDYLSLKDLFKNHNVELKTTIDGLNTQTFNVKAVDACLQVSAAQKLTEDISALLSEYERNVRSEKIKAGLARRRKLLKSSK